MTSQTSDTPQGRTPGSSSSSTPDPQLTATGWLVRWPHLAYAVSGLPGDCQTIYTLINSDPQAEALLGSVFGALNDQLGSQEVANTLLRQQLDFATARPLQPTPLPPTTNITVTNTESTARPRGLEPPLFYGDMTMSPAARQEAYTNWRTAIRMKMIIDWRVYTQPLDRIIYVAQRLTGEAFTGVRGLIDTIAANCDNPVPALLEYRQWNTDEVGCKW
ncbi:hypothetical protein QBC46DRAFT_398790 [Diplogelasinospora grovesii]|uniref:Uncharacterized protein n=1 Tax=Diplogelasinospora grovesii TaxID=303347 RepID=A0AAN6MWQ7_9PEZI|nr:hypothetical protein QBC46DRAFT_398790 [Diplogelasinospora grovesii]